jgi:regulator of cell morphogenesis and NO signaling
MIIDLTLDTPVGEWVAHRPELSRDFEELGIDYCCHGEQPLQRACRLAGLDPNMVLERLAAVESGTTDECSRDWLTAPLAELCDHIEATHHAYLKTELPRLDALIAKVIKAHGVNHPELRDVQQTFADLRAELEPHMMKEERILFPAIRAMERATRPLMFPFGSVANPVRMMQHEHDNAGQCLANLRRLTGNYTPPAGACNTYRAMLDGLRRLESDLHQHIHKENNVLFPRALAIETGARSA